MARIHRITLLAAMRMHGGRALQRGQSFTLPGGADLSPYTDDKVWQVRSMAVPDARERPSGPPPAVTPAVSSVWVGLCNRLDETIAAVRRLDEPGRAAFARMVEGQRPALAVRLAALFGDVVRIEAPDPVPAPARDYSPDVDLLRELDPVVLARLRETGAALHAALNDPAPAPAVDLPDIAELEALADAEPAPAPAAPTEGAATPEATAAVAQALEGLRAEVLGPAEARRMLAGHYPDAGLERYRSRAAMIAALERL